VHDLVSIDASKLSTRQINVRLTELIGARKDIEIINPKARHNIIVGILQKCNITVRGSLGYYCASLLDGPSVVIEGNSGWALGENLMNGNITISKDTGASVGASMRGGNICVGRNAGARAGISMKGGSLVIGGDSGFLTGFMMQKGQIIVCGDVGDAVGDSMYEGEIYVGGDIASLGNDAIIVDITKKELISVWDKLEENGIDKQPEFKKIVSGKKLYHFDKLERLEKSSV